MVTRIETWSSRLSLFARLAILLTISRGRSLNICGLGYNYAVVSGVLNRPRSGRSLQSLWHLSGATKSVSWLDYIVDCVLLSSYLILTCLSTVNQDTLRSLRRRATGSLVIIRPASGTVRIVLLRSRVALGLLDRSLPRQLSCVIRESNRVFLSKCDWLGLNIGFSRRCCVRLLVQLLMLAPYCLNQLEQEADFTIDCSVRCEKLFDLEWWD